MAEQPEWSNERILNEIFKDILRNIYDNAARDDFRERLREALDDERPVALRDFLVNVQSGPILGLIAYLDCRVDLPGMPEIALVNGETGERLSIDFGMDWAAAEGDVIDEVEPPMPPDDHTLYFYRE